MFSKNQMNVIIGLLLLGIIFLGIVGTGYLETEKKYVAKGNPNVYITFNREDNKFFYHGEGEQNFQGTYMETPTDFSIFFDDGSGAVYTRYENDSIALKPENKTVFVREECTGLQKMGL